MAKRNLLLILVGIGVALGPTGWTAAASKKKELGFAVSLARKGLWREATFRFEALTRRDPRNARLWSNLAVAYEAGGRYDDAHRAYEEAARWQRPGDLDPLDLNRSSFEAFYAVWKDQQERNTGDEDDGEPAFHGDPDGTIDEPEPNDDSGDDGEPSTDDEPGTGDGSPPTPDGDDR